MYRSGDKSSFNDFFFKKKKTTVIKGLFVYCEEEALFLNENKNIFLFNSVIKIEFLKFEISLWTYNEI